MIAVTTVVDFQCKPKTVLSAPCTKYMHSIPIMAQFHRLIVCSCAMDPDAPHWAGKLPEKGLTADVSSAPRYKAAKEGIDPLLPQEAGSLPLRGTSYRMRSDNRAKAPTLPQLAGNEPAHTHYCHGNVHNMQQCCLMSK